MARLNLVNRSKLPSFSSAFTIVELLVVIVVIGILAAITVMSYTGISNRAVASSMQSDLSNSSNQLKSYQAINGSYPTALNNNCPSTPVPDTTLCLKASPNNTYTYTSNGVSFSLTETNTNGMVYSITDNTAAVAGAPNYVLTVVAGANGSVNNVSGNYSAGSSPVIIATPNTGYLFSSWSGIDCSGAFSHSIVMNGNKTCTANFTINTADWNDGISSTVLAGKHIHKVELSSTYMYKTTYSNVLAPQGATGLDPVYPSNMSLVNPQINPTVDFSEYPAQNACKAIGGRLPNVQELNAIYTNRSTYNYSLYAQYYWSSTEFSAFNAWLVYFQDGTLFSGVKTNNGHVICVSDF